tara:strand:+ start:2206 stop:2376 length:171 start_codon:yes stop_codon:yes gene_type:complete
MIKRLLVKWLFKALKKDKDVKDINTKLVKLMKDSHPPIKGLEKRLRKLENKIRRKK